MGSREEQQQKNVENAKRTLRRVTSESETVGSSSFARIANKSKSHFMAEDVNQNDSVEKWGSRIGRLLGLGFAIVLVIYLSITYL